MGFEDVGISRVRRLDEVEDRLEQWLKAGYQGQMNYMNNHFEKRLDPTQLVPGAKSVITLTYNYYQHKEKNTSGPHIAMYAQGEDYHHVIKNKLKELLELYRTEFGSVEGRCFVDSAPVMEREWAALSGLGWLGKNTLLIHPKRGSYYFLAVMILDIALEPDDPIRDHCGTCKKCIEACPTDAISPEGYLLDASKCISYLTIELKDQIPDEFAGKFKDWIFGCDICQEVCPWNRFSKPHVEEAFTTKAFIEKAGYKDWVEITTEVFNTTFKDSPIKRTGYEGMMRNIKFAVKETESIEE